MTPILASIVGPPRVAMSIRASIAACHCGRGMLGLWKFGNVVAGVRERDDLAPVGQIDRIVKLS
jgi:hypothetical protein